MAISEEALINRIAKWERSIVDVRNSYDAYQNPNNITNQVAPAVLHFPPGFTSGLHAHHNRWNNTIKINSVLLVAPRASKGANLSYLENAAMPFLEKWRRKFQTEEVVLDMLAVAPNTSRGFLTSGYYGVGGNLLTINATAWIGCVFEFTFTEIA